MKKALKAAARGTIFPYAGEKWVALEHEASGRTLCLRLDLIPNKPFDENNCNNFATSSSKEWMNGPYLDNLIDAVKGPHAFLTTELDLTADDGLKDYGTCTVTIFSLTVDQYRRNRDVIPNADDWWWLSTAYSTAANGYEHSARLVWNDGSLHWYDAYLGLSGLRPACYLDSDLLISAEDGDEDTGVGPQEAGTIVAELVEQFGGTYATGERFAVEVSFLLGKLPAGGREAPREHRHPHRDHRPAAGGRGRAEWHGRQPLPQAGQARPCADGSPQRAV